MERSTGHQQVIEDKSRFYSCTQEIGAAFRLRNKIRRGLHSFVDQNERIGVQGLDQQRMVLDLEPFNVRCNSELSMSDLCSIRLASGKTSSKFLHPGAPINDRDLAQPGRALPWGAEGCEFEPRSPDHCMSRIMRYMTTVDRIVELQEQLRLIEAKFEPLRKSFRSPEWDAIEKDASEVRRELMELTGDPYGRPKKKREIAPDPDLLNARYEAPDHVPSEVLAWVRKRSALLTSDATDAVRWSRIIDTLEDERYPVGEISLYRAMADGDEIRPGDWVSTKRKYAEDHLRRHLNGAGQVLEILVDGQDVLVSPTGNAEEAIYAPREFSGPVMPTSADGPSP